MVFSYYIYYRIEAINPTALAASVHRLLDGVGARTGVTGRLLQKYQDPLTWMEVYEGVPDPAAFEAALAETLIFAGFPAAISRHAECFVNCRDSIPA